MFVKYTQEYLESFIGFYAMNGYNQFVKYYYYNDDDDNYDDNNHDNDNSDMEEELSWGVLRSKECRATSKLSYEGRQEESGFALVRMNNDDDHVEESLLLVLGRNDNLEEEEIEEIVLYS